MFPPATISRLYRFPPATFSRLYRFSPATISRLYSECDLKTNHISPQQTNKHQSKFNSLQLKIGHEKPADHEPGRLPRRTSMKKKQKQNNKNHCIFGGLFETGKKTKLEVQTATHALPRCSYCKMKKTKGQM
ncbi:hypothetical protein ElyMa_002874800 [Elysia marginata]|uniref:Uncharacterized protein n=1 Tax=Elysia marginata TaxID=1093978 RepID=A0AAV4HZW6_9GAST|nr:hypothetical protein ElyMa_002874800 [Elysia marginata]